MNSKTIALALLVLLIGMPLAHAGRETHRVWARIQAARAIREGKGPRPLYIFFDPNCPFCHRLYENLQALIGPERLRVTWIPVGVLEMSSFGKAAHLLEAANPQAELARNERRFARGGVKPWRARARIRHALAANARLLTDAGSNGVPFLVYQGHSGRVHSVIGDPPVRALLRIIPRIRERTSLTASPRTARP